VAAGAGWRRIGDGVFNDAAGGTLRRGGRDRRLRLLSDGGAATDEQEQDQAHGDSDPHAAKTARWPPRYGLNGGSATVKTAPRRPPSYVSWPWCSRTMP